MKRRRKTGPTQEVRDIVRQRDNWRCARCGRDVMFEESDEHHRRNRASGGSRNPAINLPSNLLLVCGTPTTGCHGWIGNHPAEAKKNGFSVSTNGRTPPSHVRVKHAVHGLVYLDDDGGWLPAGEPAVRLHADLKTAAAADAPAATAETTPNP